MYLGFKFAFLGVWPLWLTVGWWYRWSWTLGPYLYCLPFLMTSSEVWLAGSPVASSHPWWKVFIGYWYKSSKDVKNDDVTWLWWTIKIMLASEPEIITLQVQLLFANEFPVSLVWTDLQSVGVWYETKNFLYDSEASSGSCSTAFAVNTAQVSMPKTFQEARQLTAAE